MEPNNTLSLSVPGAVSSDAGSPPSLSWDVGTAYDLFISLDVLHQPVLYGLRPSWAAGTRSRLPAAERRLLEEIQPFLWVPFEWIYSLPEPKDASTALWALKQLAPRKRMLALISKSQPKGISREILERVSEQRSWSNADLEAAKQSLGEHKLALSAKGLPEYLEWWTRPEELGELYLSAVQAYYQAFFADEEKRIKPVLYQGLERAQQQANRLPLPDLLTELSQGVHFDEPFEAAELILVPAFWNTPLVMFTHVSAERMLLAFGVRSTKLSLIPGGPVPDGLLNMLKAVADPTRLQILRYLSDETLTPVQLSRRLRLRAPTVTHHLSALRLAGLVHLTLEANGERRYAARLEAVRAVCQSLEEFLIADKKEEERSLL